MKIRATENNLKDSAYVWFATWKTLWEKRQFVVKLAAIWLDDKFVVVTISACKSREAIDIQIHAHILLVVKLIVRIKLIAGNFQ